MPSPTQHSTTGLLLENVAQLNPWRDAPRLRWATQIGADDPPVIIKRKPVSSNEQVQGSGLGSPSEQTEVDPIPERQRIHPRSQAGRSQYFLNAWRPSNCRAPTTKPWLAKGEGVEEQLLYMALYRDKVAQHQADAAKKGERSQSLGPVAAAGAAVVGSVAAGGADGSISARLAGDSSKARDAGSEVGKNDSASSNPKPSPKRGAASATRGAHMCAVSANPKTGGVTSDYLESKQLGVLFDQWRQEQEDELGGPLNQSSSPRHSRELSRDPYVANSPRASRRPRRELSEQDHASSASYADDDRHAVGDATAHDAARSVRLDRMFSVITNQKVRCVSMAEKGGATARQGLDTSHIEGFPTMNLMRLHKGPWRMNV